MTDTLFPWQQTSWLQLQSMRSRMPHAILLYGPEGIGKTRFAEQLAQSLLCETPDAAGHACNQCASCGWFAQYSHPDYRRIRPEWLEQEEALADDSAASNADDAEKSTSATKTSKAPSKEIVINQIRGLADFMNISTHRQGTRVILLYPAEALNTHAANALLKSLEEPNPNTVFILVSHSIDQLLPTILSRCHQLALTMPSQQEALAWLKARGVVDADMWLAQQGGAPLAAMAMAESEERTELLAFLKELSRPNTESALKTAEKLQKLNLANTVTWLQTWLYDLFSYKQTGIIRYYPGYQNELKALAARVDINALLKAIQIANEKQAVATHPLSAKLFLEDLMLDYTALFDAPLTLN